MATLQSEQIHVFPSANRGSDYPKARLTSEENMRNIIKCIIPQKSFVVSKDSDSDFAFVMDGYYFYIGAKTNLTDKFTNDTNIYAHIKTGNTSAGTVTFNELKPVESQSGLDVLEGENYIFYGVLFDTSQTVVGAIDLHLLTRGSASDDWKIPEASKLKFINNNDYRTICIDDGDLG